ncbi:hypothetical protein EON63_19445 [archaeon]|nr:MAG: hypothetical protein EON63_19445 [archaeon]
MYDYVYDYVLDMCIVLCMYINSYTYTHLPIFWKPHLTVYHQEGRSLLFGPAAVHRARSQGS